MDENHKRFLSHLQDSQSTVWLAAKWLNSQGYNVKVNVSAKADARENWQKYADNGDLEVSQRIEVKGLSCNFTSEADWPFGADFIVCAKHAFDLAVPKPFAYIMLNKNRTHVAFIRSRTSPNWIVKKRKDSRYIGVEQDFYFADLKDVQFFPLSDKYNS